MCNHGSGMQGQHPCGDFPNDSLQGMHWAFYAPATHGGSCRRTGAYRAPAAMGIMTVLYPNAQR